MREDFSSPINLPYMPEKPGVVGRKGKKHMTYHVNLGRHKLAVTLSRRRGRLPKSFTSHFRESAWQLIKLAKDRRYSGNPLSRVLRHLFENKKSKKAFGFNLMAIALLTGIFTPPVSAFSANQGTEITNTNTRIVSLTTEHSVRNPLDSFQITQGYHLFHQGIDLAAPLGTPVYPIMDGTVEGVLFDRFSYGNHILIDHGSGLKTLYGHFSRISVKKDQAVNRNTVIGLIGSSGFSSGPHLHLEVIDGGSRVNPLTIIVVPSLKTALSNTPKSN